MVLLSSLFSAPNQWWVWLKASGLMLVGGGSDEDRAAARAVLLKATSAAPTMFDFGTRTVNATLMGQEILMNLCWTLPLAMLLGQVILRLNCSQTINRNIAVIGARADLWNAMTALIAADVVLELLLPSAQCLPTPGMFPFPRQTWSITAWSWWLVDWLRTTWGLDCYIAMSSDLLAPWSLLTVLCIRVSFVVLGLSLGQSFAPIAITGGIATGKSTIIKMLRQETEENEQKLLNLQRQRQEELDGQPQSTRETNHEYSTKEGESSIKEAPVASTGNSQHENTPAQDDKSKSGEKLKTAAASDASNANAKAKGDGDDEANDKDYYTFYVIDCDKIGHEILLPPQELAKGNYAVKPHESVYPEVCRAFEDHDIFVEKENDDKVKDGDDDKNNKCTSNGKSSTPTAPLIDRTKLGAVVFGNDDKRRTLNQLTHPRIFWILCKRCLYGCWFSKVDFTVAEVPLLFESNSWFMRPLFCLTVMVTVESTDVQLQRLHRRNPHLSEQDCQNRIQSQLPLSEKERRADFVLVNRDNDYAQVKADLMERIVERGWADRLFGVGVSAAQIVGLVAFTLAGGVSYYLYHSHGGEISTRQR
ncbi:hypothetical protein ACA910_000332 [Epithemia clementina (nom. ined.)]